jgi:hypothetical protein
MGYDRNNTIKENIMLNQTQEAALRMVVRSHQHGTPITWTGNQNSEWAEEKVHPSTAKALAAKGLIDLNGRAIRVNNAGLAWVTSHPQP